MQRERRKWSTRASGPVTLASGALEIGLLLYYYDEWVGAARRFNRRQVMLLLVVVETRQVSDRIDKFINFQPVKRMQNMSGMRDLAALRTARVREFSVR